MITIFSRKELLITMDMGHHSDICRILENNGIPYTVKVTNLQSSSVFGIERARTGSVGINQNYSYEYRIYVHKNDYEEALRFIR